MERDLATSAIGEAAAPELEAQSAVSWGAVFAGAITGLALSFVLVALAAGFGLKPASPWPGDQGDHSGERLGLIDEYRTVLRPLM